MSALGVPVLINSDRAYWLSSIGNDVVHSTIQVQEIDANVARISTLFADTINASTLNVSTLGALAFDVSGMYVSSIRGNTAFFSSMTLASDLSGGVGFVRFSVDASGIQVDGDPIRFDNLVYLTSTINIIQVSTLVDTDIFAANGYFSTFSTGSLSANTVSFNQANISSLYVSSLEAFDLSGADPKDWSLYPTLNSSITFQPGNVLSNVGNKLFFAGFELTDASGGGIDWSIYPAVSTIQMNNNILTGLSTINFQDGATLTSLTGNNLQYNGQPVQYGNASNVTRWASYPAVSSVNMAGRNLSNAASITTSNAVILGDNITSGYTFTNSLGVGGLSLTPIASLSAGGDLSVRNIEVGDVVTGLADVNIYGATALPGDNALYVQGGVQFDGGSIHGFSAGLLPVAGINTGRIDMLQAGFNILHPLVGAITTGTALSVATGGALSLAAGSYVEINTDEVDIINTTSGNQSTTIRVANIQMPASVAASVPLQINNTAGGGINLVGTAGVGQIAGFSSITGNTVFSPLLSTININLSTINGVDWQDISGSITTVSTFTNLFSQTMTTSTLNVSSISTAVVIAPLLSTININLSTINGVDWQDISGSITTVSTFTSLFAQNATISTLNVSTIKQIGGTAIKIDGTLEFVTPNSIDKVVNINVDDSLPMLTLNAQNITLGALSNTFAGSMSTQRVFAEALGVSTFTSETGVFSKDLTVSTISAPGGLAIKFKNLLEFVTNNGINNVNSINLNPLTVPILDIAASTIQLNAANTTIGSLSTLRLSTSAFSFSTATSVGSNTAFNYPLLIDYDTAGATTAAAGVAIAVQNHNFGAGAVINRIEMGARGNGENYIMSLWPGQNLEDLTIDSTQVTFNDGAFSTIINSDPYGLITNGQVKVGAGSGIVEISTNNVKVGGVNQMTATAISSIEVNTPYGNNFYTAGLQQPAIQFGTVSTSGGSGNIQVQIATPYYTNSNYVVQATMEDTNTAQMSAQTNSISSFTLYWSNGGGGSHKLAWTTFGNLPFTG